MSDWWRDVEHALDRLGADSPDPWADVVLPEVVLTPEQIAALADIDDAVAALADADDFFDEDVDEAGDDGPTG